MIFTFRRVPAFSLLASHCFFSFSLHIFGTCFFYTFFSRLRMCNCTALSFSHSLSLCHSRTVRINLICFAHMLWFFFLHFFSHFFLFSNSLNEFFKLPLQLLLHCCSTAAAAAAVANLQMQRMLPRRCRACCCCCCWCRRCTSSSTATRTTTTEHACLTTNTTKMLRLRLRRCCFFRLKTTTRTSGQENDETRATPTRVDYQHETEIPIGLMRLLLRPQLCCQRGWRTKLRFQVPQREREREWERKQASHRESISECHPHTLSNWNDNNR